MFKANQTISRKRHHLPSHQEEECVRSRENQSKTEEQDVVEKSENAYAFPPYPVPQITERKDGRTCGHQSQRQAEVRRDRVQTNRPGKQRDARRKAPFRGGAARKGDPGS